MDATAFFENERAHMRERKWLRRLAMSIVRDETVADDLVQDVCLQVLRCGALPDEPRRRLAYLAQALKHVAARAITRRRSEERKHLLHADPMPRPTAEDAFEHAETERRVLDSILKLERAQRDAVLLRYYEDLKPKEVARRLNIPVERVYKLLSDARASLREEFERSSLDSKWALILVRWSSSKPVTPTAALLSAGIAAGLLATSVAGAIYLYSSHDQRNIKPEGSALAEPVQERQPGPASQTPAQVAVEETPPIRVALSPESETDHTGDPRVDAASHDERALRLAWRADATASHGKGPRGLAIGRNHEILQVDYEAGAVLAIDYRTGAKTARSIQLNGEPEYMSCIAIDGDRLFASCPHSGVIAFDIETLAERGRAAAEDPDGAWLLNALCTDGHGNVHLLGSADSKVHVYAHDLRGGEIASWSVGSSSRLLCSLPESRILVGRGDGHETTIDVYAFQGESAVPMGPVASARFEYHVMEIAIAGGQIFLATEQLGVFAYELPADLSKGTPLRLTQRLAPNSGLRESERSNLAHMAVDADVSRVYIAYDQPARSVIAVDLEPEPPAVLEALGPPPRLAFR